MYYQTNGDVVKNTDILKRNLMIAIVILMAVLSLGIGIFSYEKGLKKGFAKGKSQGIEEGGLLVYSQILDIIPDDTFINKYANNPLLKFSLTDSQAMLITSIANLKGVDPDFCVAILSKENPSLNPNAKSKNNNGSWDRGLWQINSMYQEDFVKAFWDPFMDEPFDVFNERHNTFLAISLLADKYHTFNDYEKAGKAYNCGERRVYKGTEPSTTINYISDVMSIYEGLKNPPIYNLITMLN